MPEQQTGWLWNWPKEKDNQLIFPLTNPILYGMMYIEIEIEREYVLYTT